MYKLPKARQNADDQVASGFSFVSDWSESGASFLDQSQSKVKGKQTNHRAKYRKSKSIAEYFRHSVEISLFLLFSYSPVFLRFYFF